MTEKEELDVYREWFAFMYMCRNITMDVAAIEHAMSYIDTLGRSWTVGNGEIDNSKLHAKILKEMTKSPWRDSAWNSGKDTPFKKERKKQIEDILQYENMKGKNEK